MSEHCDCELYQTCEKCRPAPPDAPETTLRRLAQEARQLEKTWDNSSWACDVKEAYQKATLPSALLSLLAAHAREVETLMRERDEAVSYMPTERDDCKPRLLLNAYGRRCYDAGRDAAEARATTAERERDEAIRDGEQSAVAMNEENDRHIARIVELESELRTVDLVLGNRTALDSQPTRDAKIAHIIRVAQAADPKGELAKLKADMDGIITALGVLKLNCDREWGNESPRDIIHIAANALHWRGREIEDLRAERDALQAELVQMRLEPSETNRLRDEVGTLSRYLTEAMARDRLTAEHEELQQFCESIGVDYDQPIERLKAYIDGLSEGQHQELERNTTLVEELATLQAEHARVTAPPNAPDWPTLNAHYTTALELINTLRQQRDQAVHQTLDAVREIVMTEEELYGQPPPGVLHAMDALGPIENARAAVRATKASILTRLAALRPPSPAPPTETL